MIAVIGSAGILVGSIWFFGFWTTIIIALILIGVALIYVVISADSEPDAHDGTQLRFVYCDARGEVSTRTLIRWTETDGYIEGICLTRNDIRTFRKDRIVSFLDGKDVLLSSPNFRHTRRSVKKTSPDQRPQILFTGFSDTKRTELEFIADSADLHVVKTITKNLSYLCIGPNAGPAKVEKARAQHVYILDESQLHTLLETGELIDS